MKIMPKSDPWKIIKIGNLNVEFIKKEVLGFYDKWLIDTSRQKIHTTHEHTFAYILLDFDYAWRPGQLAKSVIVNKLTDFAEKELNLIYKLLEESVDGKVVKSEIISMNPKSRIRTHRDRSDMLYVARRFHVPIKTTPETFFIVEEENFFLEEGCVYELNNSKYHAVRNNSSEFRIHLIVDVIPNAYLEGVSFE